MEVLNQIEDLGFTMKSYESLITEPILILAFKFSVKLSILQYKKSIFNTKKGPKIMNWGDVLKCLTLIWQK